MCNSYLQHSDFSHRNFLDRLIFVGLKEFLDCDDLTVFAIPAFDDHAVAALADDALVIVLVHVVESSKDFFQMFFQLVMCKNQVCFFTLRKWFTFFHTELIFVLKQHFYTFNFILNLSFKLINFAFMTI